MSRMSLFALEPLYGMRYYPIFFALELGSACVISRHRLCPYVKGTATATGVHCLEAGGRAHDGNALWSKLKSFVCWLLPSKLLFETKQY